MHKTLEELQQSTGTKWEGDYHGLNNARGT